MTVPLSFTWKIMDTVPGVCPGISTNVTVLPAKRDVLAVHGDDVALGLAVRKQIDGLFDHFPIAFTDDDPGTEAVLHLGREGGR